MDWLVPLLVVDIILIIFMIYIYSIVSRVRKTLKGLLTAASINHRIRKAVEETSQKPRRRYIVFTIETTENIDERSLARAIIKTAEEILGEVGLVDSGIHLVYYDPVKRLGVIRVKHLYKYHALAILGLVRDVNGVKIRILPLGTSGTLKKALKRVGARKKL
ncbi:MAG: hypothetical protein F7C38_03945 [Desulfurococcales archaeon]|nr:hypothetical protein [Desulfurococcales archaeon]